MAKKYKHVWTMDQSNPQASYRKIWYRQKRHRFQQFLNISVYSDPKSRNKALILKKNPKLNPFVIKSVLETNCKCFLKNQ